MIGVAGVIKQRLDGQPCVLSCHRVVHARQRLDEQLLGGFKEQVGATLGDARRAEQVRVMHA